MKLHLLYIGDAWLSNSSLELLAVCTSFEKAVELAVEQTYGLDNNYMISSAITDTLDI